jgi:hypothetical protein
MELRGTAISISDAVECAVLSGLDPQNEQVSVEDSGRSNVCISEYYFGSSAT